MSGPTPCSLRPMGSLPAVLCKLLRWRHASGCRRVLTSREMVEVGLLMSYGTSIADMFRQVGHLYGEHP